MLQQQQMMFVTVRKNKFQPSPECIRAATVTQEIVPHCGRTKNTKIRRLVDVHTELDVQTLGRKTHASSWCSPQPKMALDIYHWQREFLWIDTN